MNLRKPFSASPAVTGSGRPASRKALRMPSVPPWAQMPSILGRDGSAPAVLRWAVAESQSPAKVDMTLICGFLAKTLSAPLFRSVSTEVPATPVTRMMFPPLAPSLSTRNCASASPNLTWSVLTCTPHPSVTVLSNDTTRMPRSQACLTTPFRPVGEAALMMIASTRCEIRFEICCDCFDTSLPELQTVQSARSFQPSDEQTDVKSLTISTRHLLPMYELDSAILYFLPWAAWPLFDALVPPPPPDEPPQAASSSAAATPAVARVNPWPLDLAMSDSFTSV